MIAPVPSYGELKTHSAVFSDPHGTADMVILQDLLLMHMYIQMELLSLVLLPQPEQVVGKSEMKQLEITHLKLSSKLEPLCLL